MPAQTDTQTTKRVAKPLAQKLLQRFVTGPVSERRPDLGPCWLWTGNVGKDGYARIHSANGSLAHRLMFELVRGPIPFGLELDHLCAVRDCVNPWHLEPVSHAENCRRGRNVNREKTACLRGHPLTGSNLRTLAESRGDRGCKACHNQRQREYLQRKRDVDGDAATPTLEVPLAA